MGDRIGFAEGEKLVKLARKSIKYFLASGIPLTDMCEDKKLLMPRGVFVTLHTFPEKELRGCIGIATAARPLWAAIEQMSVAAATEDPRFKPLRAEELGRIVVEVSVLTEPEFVSGDRKDLPKKIHIGKDGLIVQRGQQTGLLLPQVATEQGWNAEQFLENACLKAGLMGNMWQLNETKVFKFQAQIFTETEPNGTVEETG